MTAFQSLFVLRDTETVRAWSGREPGENPSSLCAASTEPDVGRELTDHETVT